MDWAGLLTQKIYDESEILASGELQGEYMAAEQFSVYGSLGYNRIFYISPLGGGGSFGYGSLLVGPRGYINPRFFIGFGAGIAYATGQDASASWFNYNPHIGYNTKNVQVTLGYYALSNTEGNVGFIQLKAILKFKRVAKKSPDSEVSIYRLH